MGQGTWALALYSVFCAPKAVHNVSVDSASVILDTPLKTASQESRASRTIREIFESGRPIAYIRSSEEQRAAGLVREVAHRLPVPAPQVWQWTLTEGLRRDGEEPVAGTRDPRAALDFILAHDAPAIFHLKDFHEPLRDSAEIRRRMRDVYEAAAGRRKYIAITSPVHQIPAELERNVMYLDLRPPDVIELTAFVSEEARRLTSKNASEADIELMARSLLGLTLDEAGYALRRAVMATGGFGAAALPAVREEKRLLVNRSGYIEYIADGATLGEVGGLEGLKKWLVERQKLFEMRDSLSAEIVPKGLLLMGIPGCGKSLSIKAIASAFQLPLYRVDMIEIFSGRHGKPEGAFVAACRMMEDMAPAVLWFDEIEMGITSTDSGGEQGRIFAFFLTWMQEKTRGLFVAATANRIDLLPAEMIRKGRFDEVFFVDLPLDAERFEIFKIHLNRRGAEASRFDIAQLVKLTVGWTGAEIEQCVVSAITQARLADREVNDMDLISIAVKIVPLSRTMKEQIIHIRSWAFERAVRASPQVR
jgi:SpoVK/Ycf46/Vps4 family AAA+-type ATPase